MTTIATFSGFQAADLARARLESAGVPATYPSEAADVWVLGAAPIVGGVRLQVADEDVERALEILAEPAAETAQPPAAG